MRVDEARAHHDRRERFGADRLKPRNGGAPRAPKPRRWNHQQELWASKGKKITLTFTPFDSAPFVTGTLIDADQFTIKIQTPGTEPVVYSKHAITSYAIS